jgi:hypothetical protein
MGPIFQCSPPIVKQRNPCFFPFLNKVFPVCTKEIQDFLRWSSHRELEKKGFPGLLCNYQTKIDNCASQEIPFSLCDLLGNTVVYVNL